MQMECRMRAIVVDNFFLLPVSDFLRSFVPVPVAALHCASVSTLQQRLSHPSGQHFLAHELVPRRKALSTKIAQRCSHCNKHLVKPGPGASKPTFEIHMAAVSFIPTVTIAQFPPLRVDEETDIMYVGDANRRCCR